MTQIYPKSWKALTTARRWRLPLFFFFPFFSLMGPTNSALWWLLDITSNLLHLPLVMPCEEWLSELHFKKFLQCCSSSSPGFSHKPFCSYCCFLTYTKISWQPSFLFPPSPLPLLPVYFFFLPLFSGELYIQRRFKALVTCFGFTTVCSWMSCVMSNSTLQASYHQGGPKGWV